MDTRVILPDSEPTQTISEVVAALRSKKLKPKHEKKDWGDWITFAGKETVIAIESARGLTSSATVESLENEWDFNLKILQSFAKLGWMGEDENGPYPL